MSADQTEKKTGARGRIDAQTALYAVLGNPVGHSLSPVMHNAAFAHAGHNGVYVALEVVDLPAAVSGLRAMDVAGASVTIPFKTAVIDYLDAVDPAAAAIGAVNTIVNDNGRLIGVNTDGRGALRALTEIAPVAGQTVAVIGAGGAARAIAHALKPAGARVIIVNRGAARGEKLAVELDADFVPLADFSGKGCDAVVNTTPVGMRPHPDAMPLDEKILRPGMVVMDAVYNPLTTRLLAAADRAGCRCVSGVEMFVYQGAMQFELWTDRSAPVALMRSVVLAALAGGYRPARPDA